MPSPGLLFVTSKILDSNRTSEEGYDRFYIEEHLPNVLNYTKGPEQIKLALRYRNVNTDSGISYIALYRLTDVQTMLHSATKELVDEKRMSKTFDGENIYDYIDFGLRPYEQIQIFEGYGHASKSGTERGQTLVCVAMEPAEGQDQDFEDWYRKQHLDMLSMCRGYRRTTRYRRIDGASPRYLALHEYACKPEELPSDQLAQVTGTEWSQKIIKEAQVFQRDVFQLIQVQGDASLKL